MTNMSNGQEQWLSRLLAYLHDPPCKPLCIKEYNEVARKFIQEIGITTDEYQTYLNKTSDYIAAAVDSFPMPQEKCTAKFTGMQISQDKESSTFKHPFSGTNIEIPDLKELSEYEEVLQNAIEGIKDNSAKEKLFLLWRNWLDNACETKENHAGDLALFPADARLPDHTIWNHMSITAAIEACREDDGEIKPAFLIFQAGPVQEFIAQARSTRDLWSGSYMLSWLTGSAMKAVTDELGPTSIIFPALNGIGIFDILNKDLYQGIRYSNANGSEESLWDRLYNSGTKEEKIKSAEILLNPALPNRFFAIVPQSQAIELAQKAEKAFKQEFRNISNHCWKRFVQYANSLGIETNEGWKTRWDKQVELLPEITWQITEVEEDLDALYQKAEKLPAMQSENNSLKTLKKLVKLATETIKVEDRDSEYYNESKTKLKNWGITWAVNYAMCEYALSARRNTREFDAFVTDENQHGTVKDFLTGKEEIIGSEDFWDFAKEENNIFKNNEGPYGAISITKRLWCKDFNNSRSYLFEKLDIDESIFQKVISADSVEDIAKRNTLTKKEIEDGKPKSSNKYIAIIALDGDSMGKWMSGEKARPFVNQIAGKAPEYFEGLGVDSNLLRPLAPSYHLQLSESLANFANHLAGKIVKQYKGQLIYAGGDDVLAMVPATKAMECVQALRAVFRGDKEYFNNLKQGRFEFDIPQNGIVKIGKNKPLIVPGTEADISCGIAIAHFKHPLQRVVKEARMAESRAKKEYKRSAFSFTLLKRGGETVHWGSKWDTHATQLLNQYSELRKEGKVSNRFPYALAQLLAPYKLEANTANDYEEFNRTDVIKKELETVLENQVSDKKTSAELRESCQKYLKGISTLQDDSNICKWDDFSKLFLTAAFIERERGE